MNLIKIALPLAAALTLTACEGNVTTVATPGQPPVVVSAPDRAPAAPTVTSGPVKGSDSMDGTWNLVAKDCGKAASPGALTIAGNKFTFPRADCTATASTVETNFTAVTLGCSGGPNRQLNVSMRPGQLRVTEDTTTLTYYKCM